MARKRQKKFRRHRGDMLEEEQAIPPTSLEEDLRQQRSRQKERLEAKQRDAGAHDHSAGKAFDFLEEAFEPDFENPTTSQGSSLLPQHLIAKGNAVRWPSHFSPQMSSLCPPIILQQSPGLTAQFRTRLYHWTITKRTLEATKINDRASLLFCKKVKWSDHLLPGNMHCSWDMTCKHHLHPSARTLDVAQWQDEDYPQLHACQSSKETPLPTVATVLQGGVGLYQPATEHRESRIHTLRCKPAHTVRMHEKSRLLGAIVRNDHSSASYKFHWYALPHAANYMEADLQTPAHDFCFGMNLVVFACPRFGGPGRNSTLFPLFLPLDHPDSSQLRSLNVQNFPQSDALRVEMCCENEKYLAFGHRNGQVSLLDLRQSHTNCSIIQTKASSAELGSVMDLKFRSNQTQLLLKRSFGPCQLHDLRKLSPCPSSLIHTYTIPDQEKSVDFHKMLSSNCNGFVETANSLVVPYMNMSHQPCLGAWSLATGDFVGRKVLYENWARETYFIEICSKATPAYHGPSHTSKSAFGVWMKCGRLSESKINSKAGSLHHVKLPGQWTAS